MIASGFAGCTYCQKIVTFEIWLTLQAIIESFKPAED